MLHVHTSRPVHWALRATLALAVVALASCGDSKNQRKVYPVKGKILVNGQPAPECQVYLIRTSDDNHPSKVTPQGMTNENGEFQLTTYASNDGAPEGEYVVTIEWRERSGGLGQLANYDGPDRLGGIYAKAEKTKGLKGFVVKVERTPLELAPFELTQSAELKRRVEEAKRRKPGLSGGPLGGDR